jgi:hypothetical protein
LSANVTTPLPRSATMRMNSRGRDVPRWRRVPSPTRPSFCLPGKNAFATCASSKARAGTAWPRSTSPITSDLCAEPSDSRRSVAVGNVFGALPLARRFVLKAFGRHRPCSIGAHRAAIELALWRKIWLSERVSIEVHVCTPPSCDFAPLGDHPGSCCVAPARAPLQVGIAVRIRTGATLNTGQ